MTDLQQQLQASLGGRYTLERELGRGGMATVYLATDEKHHRPVALKVLHSERAVALGPERFRREIAMVARLQHPHILSVFDSGETDSGHLWFTMPFVDGETLRDRLRRDGQLPIPDAIRIAREAALALQYAHSQGVIHRDVKPENLLLTADGSTLVADFGVARALEGGGDATANTLTAPGVAIGTPAYMSPEQASGEREVDARTDVYALGSVVYEMLAGEPPFTGASAQAVITKRFATGAPSVSVLRDGVPPALASAIATALERSPADRYATAAAFGSALELAEHPQGGRSMAAGSPRFARRPAVIAAVVVVIAVVAAGGVLAWHYYRGLGPAVAGPVGVAVLPFEVVGDTANAYFAAGITDEIRSKLSQLPSLRLIASASSNQYLHTAKPQEQIGRELGVHYLLTGRVKWEQSANGAKRVRVSPELVEVGQGTAPETRWQQSYDTTLADVFDVQSAVATRVADKLGVVLSPPAKVQLEARPTQNLAAYDLYLRSAALIGHDPPTMRRAVSLAEQAVALDSAFVKAWSQLSILHSQLYVLTIPTPADADAARRAADRAVAAAPLAPEGYLARGYYYARVAGDPAAARADYETALRFNPSLGVAIGALSGAEAASGRWSAALDHAHQAAALDPRSARQSGNLDHVLLWLRRYPEASAEAERGLVLAPGDLELTELRAMSRIGEGDLAGAQAVLRDTPPTLDRAALTTFVATYWDLYWVLDSADRALLLTLQPAAFDDDRGAWSLVRTQLYRLAGDSARSRAYADSARIAYEANLKTAPNDWQQHELLGLALADNGQRAAAEREGERGLAGAIATGDQFAQIPYAHHLLARIYVACGDADKALSQIQTILANPYFISGAWLGVDPTWTPLKGNPRFERMVAARPQPVA
jgi:eukaryotic-like serine/threonine-protein kinase